MMEECITVLQKIPKCITYIYTMLVVCTGFVMFRAETISQGLYITSQMFTGISYTRENISFVLRQLTPWFLTMLFAGIIGMAPVKPVVNYINGLNSNKTNQNKWKNITIQISLYILSVLLLVFCIIRLSGGTYNPFIYFRF